MRDYPGYHTIQLENSCDFDHEGREVCCAGGCCRPWSFTNTGDLDEVGPGYEKGRVILPMESTFEEIRSRAIWWSVDEGNARLRDMVIDFDSLSKECLSGWSCNLGERKHIPNHSPMQSTSLSIAPAR